MNLTRIENESPFDAIRHFDKNGKECWYARELMTVLNYQSWQKFNKIVENAIENLETVTKNAFDHIIRKDKMVKRPQGGGTKQLDYKLSRLACYHVALCCDSRGNTSVKMAQSYFVAKTYAYHQLEQIGLAENTMYLETDLVSIHKGRLVTDSLTLAKTFEKEHKNVTKEIRSKLNSSQNETILGFYNKHFIECTYVDSMKREQTKYLLTREGFSLIALGFTGEKAELFKIQYIEAFEKMNEKLRGYALAHFFRDTTKKQIVYVIRNTVTGLLKIGITNNLKRRVNQLECATGCELETVFCSVIADNAKEIEKILHSRFADFRQRGEWFNVDTDLVVNAITKLPFILENESEAKQSKIVQSY